MNAAAWAAVPWIAAAASVTTVVILAWRITTRAHRRERELLGALTEPPAPGEGCLLPAAATDPRGPQVPGPGPAFDDYVRDALAVAAAAADPGPARCTWCAWWPNWDPRQRMWVLAWERCPAHKSPERQP